MYYNYTTTITLLPWHYRVVNSVTSHVKWTVQVVELALLAQLLVPIELARFACSDTWVFIIIVAMHGRLNV